jgi:hypothetical protein
MSMVRKRPEMSNVFIWRNYEDDRSGPERIGKLTEKRSKDGELLLMKLDPLPTEREGLRGSNILYFRKKADGLYSWMDFETYADQCEDWDYPDLPESACSEIDFGLDTQPPGRERGMLQRVLEDAERTIELIRLKKAIQTLTQRGTGWEIRNEVRPGRRARTLSTVLLRPTKRAPAPDCDISVDLMALKRAIHDCRAKSEPRKFQIALAPSKGGIELSVVSNQRSRATKLRAHGEWGTRIVVAGSKLLLHTSKASGSNIRLTYLARRLFLDQVSIPAKEG